MLTCGPNHTRSGSPSSMAFNTQGHPPTPFKSRRATQDQSLTLQTGSTTFAPSQRKATSASTSRGMSLPRGNVVVVSLSSKGLYLLGGAEVDEALGGLHIEA